MKRGYSKKLYKGKLQTADRSIPKRLQLRQNGRNLLVGTKDYICSINVAKAEGRNKIALEYIKYMAKEITILLWKQCKVALEKYQMSGEKTS